MELIQGPMQMTDGPQPFQKALRPQRKIFVSQIVFLEVEFQSVCQREVKQDKGRRKHLNSSLDFLKRKKGSASVLCTKDKDVDMFKDIFISGL